MSRAIASVILLILLSSCASQVKYRTAVDSFMNATPSYSSMAEFKYDSLPSDAPVTFRLDKKSDSFVFPSGKSYFKAFRLPDRATPYRIHIKSFALGSSVYNAHVFYPQLALLDEQFTARKLSNPRDFMLRKAGYKETASLSWGLMRIKLEGTMKMDISDARYLVIYTTKELMASETNEFVTQQIQPIPTTIPGGMFTGALPAGTLPVSIPNSPYGWLSIQIEY